MNKPRLKTFKRYEIKISEQEKKVILHFLEGGISTRELGKALGCSHQQAINMIGSICRQWYQQGHLCFHNPAKRCNSGNPKGIIIK